jgi:hypothetical protein
VTVSDIPNESPALNYPRKPVDVHIRGDQAFMNGSSLKAVGSIVLGIVILGIWPALGLLGRLRRSRDPGASRTNDPSGHFQL